MTYGNWARRQLAGRRYSGTHDTGSPMSVTLVVMVVVVVVVVVAGL